MSYYEFKTVHDCDGNDVLTVEIPRANLELWHHGYSYGERRQKYAYRIETPDGILFESGSGDHIYSGVGAAVDLRAAFETLLSFLDACAEANEDSENASLFPPHVKEWAEWNIGELGYIWNTQFSD